MFYNFQKLPVFMVTVIPKPVLNIASIFPPLGVVVYEKKRFEAKVECNAYMYERP
jgi:hypothetical protein